MKVINTIVFLFFNFSILCQTAFYQDILKGGFTGSGFSTGGVNGGNGNFVIDIEIGSSIKKAFLFCTKYDSIDQLSLDFNGNILAFNESSKIGLDYNAPYAPPNFSAICSVHALDVSSFINPVQLTYPINIPIQPTNTTINKFGDFYLCVIYENNLLNTLGINIGINDKMMTNSVEYNFTDFNSFDLNFPFGLSINTDIIWDTIMDGSLVYVNNNYIGIIGGDENGYTGSGVDGDFYYQNSQLYGLHNDSPDNILSGADGLADISTYLMNYLNPIHIRFEKQITSPFNIYSTFHFAYTTTCDTFSVSVPNDTTVCQGETLQLFATGGNSTGALPAYEWIPATGLSCNTCPNPIFTADSSMLYTVRIRNNDSCSVVRPVKIIVRPKPQIGSILIVPSECGTTNGSITVNSMNGTQLPISYTIDGNLPQSNSVFSNLSASNYTIALIDGFGCQSEDSLVEVGTVNSTIANFTVSPSTGAAPLTVAIANSSQNANNFNWFVNDIPQGTSLNAYTFNTSGNYTIELVAWQFDPTCADTFSLTISVYDSVIIQIPNVFTPNNDGINDHFSLNSNFELQADVSIVNRWGNEVFSFTGNINAGTTNLWDGKDIFTQIPVFDGTYFYKITFTAPEGSSLPFETGTFPISKEGFVEVRSSH
ncbi:MAG: gliding motility-associated C-terminal domain-containing protein [Crocinitomicaceae bacterium]|nr:gliding motility-associated C-terminal domain-containing protein [Crocinitomicaceae bacterium]MCF8433850.1 gliding motility-associated C-terminal domain-containing protein [Crocinitomicaceae bacterium]